MALTFFHLWKSKCIFGVFFLLLFFFSFVCLFFLRFQMKDVEQEVQSLQLRFFSIDYTLRS